MTGTLVRLCELLSTERIGIRSPSSPEPRPSKSDVLADVARLLERGSSVTADAILRVLTDRENLQSTGIGDGVAIPHGALVELSAQCAALLVVPAGVPFDAIDGADVTLIFAVVGPKHATGEHLKTLARVSRLLRSAQFRERLVRCSSPDAIYALIAEEEGCLKSAPER
jgi:PTS system nitrogen regulatory IIA component